jgi:hypothetical protein
VKPFGVPFTLRAVQGGILGFLYLLESFYFGTNITEMEKKGSRSETASDISRNDLVSQKI